MAHASPILFIIISCLFTLSKISNAENNTLKQGQLLRDWEQLVSAGSVFRLGFFTPNPTYFVQLGYSGSRYLGIWFDQMPFYSVWVGNRESPVPDSSGALTIDGKGNLKITYQDGLPIIINPNMKKSSLSGNFTATLLDSGNLVIQQVDSNGIAGPVLWQSFDYPHNILLPGMKLGINLKTGKNWTLTSWLSHQVPAPGAFKLGLDPNGSNQLLIWRRDEIYWSSGVWKNGSFELAPELTKTNNIFNFKFFANKEEKYFSFTTNNKSILARWRLDTIGEIKVFALDMRENATNWIFESVSPCQSELKNSTAVCLSEKPNKCKNGSEFFAPRRGLFNYDDKLFHYDDDLSLGLSDCHSKCWKNCSCVAYQPLSSDGTGCQFWSKGSKFTPDDTLDFVYLLSHQSNKTKV